MSDSPIKDLNFVGDGLFFGVNLIPGKRKTKQQTICKLATINRPNFPPHGVYTHMPAPNSSRESVSNPTAVRLQGETLRNLPADCNRPAPTGYSRTLTKIWHHFSTEHVSTWPSQLKVPGSTSSFPPHDITDKDCFISHTNKKISKCSTESFLMGVLYAAIKLSYKREWIFNHGQEPVSSL